MLGACKGWFKKGQVSPRKGVIVTEETRELMSKAKLGKPSNMNGKHHTEEAKKKNREAHLGSKNSNFGKCFSEEHKRKISEATKGKSHPLHTEEWKRYISEMLSKRCKEEPEFKEKLVKNFNPSHIKPNKKESFLNDLIHKNFPNQYKLNVFGDTIINGKIPDWINCNGQKKAILFNGIYWHLWRLQKKEHNFTKEIIEEKERKPYDELGFKVLFIWEDELDNIEEVIQKISEFNDV